VAQTIVSRAKLSLLAGMLITALAFALFFAFPTRNNYLAAPGMLLAWKLNGGVHGSGLGGWFRLWFWGITVGANLAMYSIVAWIVMRSFGRPRQAASS